ncbi:MAG TPA: DUF58 domain-containing protein [Verrucomicrobia bacterium]|nr:DUF58 domain-containing protein [Verrucomicrobiota bacterium]
MRICLTRTGRVFLGVTTLLYLASLTSQSGLLLLPIGVIFGCAFINIKAAWQTVRHLKVSAPDRTLIPEGANLTEPWMLSNPGKQRAGFITIESDGMPLLQIEALAPKSSVSTIPELRYLKRGVYSYSKLTLSSIYPFGLLKVRQPLDLSGEVVVYPDIFPCQAPKAAGFDAMVGGKFKGTRKSSSGSEFSGIRPFQIGDTLKSIHWKSSSKGAGLMVKTFDEELSGRVALLIDTGQNGNSERLDDCLRVVGSLAFEALEAGHHIEWVNIADGRMTLYPPFTDGQEILNQLAGIQRNPNCVTPSNLTRAVQSTNRKSAVNFILTEWHESIDEILDLLLNDRRKTAIYLPMDSIHRPNDSLVPVYFYDTASLHSKQ